MSHSPSNYQQNYQNYYQCAPEQYDDYYEDETQDLKQNYEDVPPDLQVPNSKLYAEGYPDDNERYVTNAQFDESQQQVENTSLQYRQEYDVAPNDYYYTDPQPHYHHHRTRVPKTQPPPIQNTSSFRYLLPHSLYPSCPLATSTSQQGTTLNQGTILNPATGLNQGTCHSQGECSYIPKIAVSAYQGTGKNLPKTVGVSNFKIVDDNYNAAQGYNENFETYEKFEQNQRTAYQNPDNYADFNDNERTVYQNQEYYDLNQEKVYQTQENYDQNHIKAYPTQKTYTDYNQYQNPENFGDYCNVGARPGYVGQYGSNQYIDYKGKRFSYYGTKAGAKGTNMKKYPVTVKTTKYVNKNQVTQLLHKRPSALCLPQVTQPDPGLVKRKCKTHHNLKKPYDQCEPIPQNPPADTNYSFSAPQIHCQGDMNQNAMARGLDTLLDQFENKIGFNQNTGNSLEGEENTNKIKEFSKFLKPRVPSSIRAKQDRIANMKSSLNMSSSLQPKMKLSLDKLLNRLQKCESGEKISVKSSRSGKLDEKEQNTESKDVKHKSFNYETLTRKLSPRMEDPEEEESKSIPNKPSTSLTTSLDHKKSSRLIRPLDDNCAIDLHRSKSYIVDLIDRALSKELGTVPRGQVEEDMTPKRAITTISRHRQSGHKELCYEVTAALTDSFISNATAPPSKQDLLSQSLKRCESDGCGEKKLCKSLSDEVDYIKQLKQLRWGHIRHIQHEARKLADLEEFLEKCGEIEY